MEWPVHFGLFFQQQSCRFSRWCPSPDLRTGQHRRSEGSVDFVRDNDKQKVYEAEWELRKILDMPRTFVELHGSTFLVPDERRFGSVESIQTFVDQVLDHVECNRPVRVRVRKGQTQAHYQ